MIRSRKVLSHARGQPCQLALPGICSHDPETTVFAHLNGHAFGKGSGNKAHDIAGCFADHACHSYLDTGHGTNPVMSDYELATALLRAVVGTWLVLIEDGIIFVPQDQAVPLMERPVPARKPKNQRAKIQSNPTRKIQSRGFEKKPRRRDDEE